MSDHRLNVLVTIRPFYLHPPASDEERERRAQVKVLFDEAEKYYTAQIQADILEKMRQLLEHLNS